MQLSEAIRLGAMATEPCYGPIFNRGTDGVAICGTCAIGAPMYALFGDKARDVLHAQGPNLVITAIEHILAERWPWTIGQFAHPATVSGYRADLITIMVNLFEFRRWSREQIADWVATIEPPEAEPVADPVRTPVAVEA